MRNAYIKTIYELARDNDKIFSLIADIGAYLMRDFKRDFPERCFNLGIAESNMIGVAAGLALSKKIPFVYTITPFVTLRCYDHIRVDVCYQNLNVKIVGVGCGISYAKLGASHHSLVDIAAMRALPNMTVLSPADPLEAGRIIGLAAEYEGPVYIRLALTGEPDVHSGDNGEYQIGKGQVLREGNDAAIIATGVMVHNALAAAADLQAKGLNCRVINIHTIKPVDKEIILKAVEETRAIVTLEEHSIIGGLGSAVAEVLAEEKNNRVYFKRIGFEDTFCLDYGKRPCLQEKYGLSAAFITKEIQGMLHNAPE
jgi:transketolase